MHPTEMQNNKNKQNNSREMSEKDFEHIISKLNSHMKLKGQLQAQIRGFVQTHTESLDGPAKDWIKAVRDPFCDQAIGVRIPDEYSYPTVTYKQQSLTSWTPATGGGMNLVLLPNPVISVYVFAGTFSGSSLAQINGQAAYGFCVPTTVASVFSSYRVTCAGWRLRNIAGLGNNISGSISVAPLLVPEDTEITYDMISNYSVPQANLISSLTNTSGSSNLLEGVSGWPLAKTYPMDELVENVLCLSSAPVTPGALAFNVCNTNASNAALNATDTYFSGRRGSLVFAAGSILTISVGGTGFSGGRVAWVLEGQGLTGGVSSLQIEFIFHMEGPVKFVTNDSANNFIPEDSSSVTVSRHPMCQIIKQLTPFALCFLKEAAVLSVSAVAGPASGTLARGLIHAMERGGKGKG